MASTPLSRRMATLIGFSAVLLWSLLAVLTAASGTMPALQLMAISFGIGGLFLLVLRPGSIRAMRQPWPVWLLGVGGLFGYHFCYSRAAQRATGRSRADQLSLGRCSSCCSRHSLPGES